MTLDEIKTEIDNLEERRFYLSMKDRWTSGDFELYRALSKLTNELWDLYFEVQKNGA